MTTHNADNERIKRQYFTYLKEAKRHSEPTVDAVAKAISRFEDYTKRRDFKMFRPEQAVAFKRHFGEQRNQRTTAVLSKATMHSTLGGLKAFFHWLAGQPGYKSRLRYSDAEYFNLSEKDVRVATARRNQLGPTLEQLLHVLNKMPTNTAVERRNRALVAFTTLTGARDGAIASFKLKHVDLKASCVHQDARDVKTKFSKTFTTYFFPVGDEFREVLDAWIAELKTEQLWGDDDPLFPATQVVVGENKQFAAVGLTRTHWSNATPIRRIFREAFETAGLPYFNPHSLRHTLVRLGASLCKTAEEFKAWSQNAGHEHVLTSLRSYGQVDTHRQAEIMLSLGRQQDTLNIDASAVISFIEKQMAARR